MTQGTGTRLVKGMKPDQLRLGTVKKAPHHTVKVAEPKFKNILQI